MPQSRVHIIVTGLVQGVFFRQSTIEVALAKNITGSVMNLPSGNEVEIIAEGSEERLHELIEFCKTGSDQATVENVMVQWQAAEHNLKSFVAKWQGK